MIAYRILGVDTIGQAVATGVSEGWIKVNGKANGQKLQACPLGP
jgi:hypothetical protein